jgi:REP element-mobilizing transposase RayT
VPKYRKKVFYGKRRREIGEILRQLCRQKDIELIEGNAAADHIHMLLSVPPKYSIAMTIGFLKGKSAIRINRNLMRQKGSLVGRAFVLVHRELEFLLLGISEWGRTSCRKSRGIVPRRFIALMPIPKGGRSGGRSVRAASRPPFGLGPWVGARVAPLRCPVFRPGHWWL